MFRLGLRRLVPRFVPKVWGSRDLTPFFRNQNRDIPIGEVQFEGADDIAIQVKFLFTSEPLSIQVHPDGNAELWRVIDAKPRASITCGFRKDILITELRSAAGTDRILPLLETYLVAPGDTFLVPGGTVHSIGAGMILCEIKSRSEEGFRLYDHGRPPALGRTLGVDEAMGACHRNRCDPRKILNPGEIVSCPLFTVLEVQVSEKYVAPPEDQNALWVVIRGSGEIAGQSTCAGDVWYATGSPPFEVTGMMNLLKATPGTAN